MKDRFILIGLDAISMLLAFILLIFSICVTTYSFDSNAKYMFTGIGIISIILLYNSIMSIMDEKK